MIANLDEIFGNKNRLKLMKLFVFNKNATFTPMEAAERAQIKKNGVRKEINALERAGLLKKKSNGYTAKEDFPFFMDLHNLLLKSVAFDTEGIVKRLRTTGRVKLVIVSGIFTQTPECRIDLLVVGDGIRDNRLETAMRATEAEVGSEVRYASLTTNDFKYRMGIYDRLVRDILDFPHEKVFNKLGV